MPHFQKKMDLKLSVGVRYDAICIERLSQNRRTDRNGFDFGSRWAEVLVLISVLT